MENAQPLSAKVGAGTPVIKPARRMPRWARIMLAFIMAVMVFGLFLASAGYYALSRGPIALNFVQNRIENQLNALPGAVAFRLGGVQIVAGERPGDAVIRLRDIHIIDEHGLDLVLIPEAQTDFSLLSALRGRIRPRNVQVHAADISLIRDQNGKMNVGTGMGGDPEATPRPLFNVFDEFWQSPTFSDLASIRLIRTAIKFDDQAAGRIWDIHDGLIEITRAEQHIEVRAELETMAEHGEPITALLSARRQIGDRLAAFSIKFSNAPPQAVADEIAAFGWLRTLDAPVSGSIQMQMSDTGTVSTLSGVLEVGKGQLARSLAAKSQPVRFDAAKVYFSFDAAQDIFEFSDITVQTSAGSIHGQGHAYLERQSPRKIDHMVAQFQLSKLVFVHDTLFEAPIYFSGGSLDAKLSFDPFRIDIGNFHLQNAHTHIRVKGHSLSHPDYWQNAYDITIDQMSHRRLMQYWPKTLVPNTRHWVGNNIHQAKISQIEGALRTKSGKPAFTVTFDLNDVNAKYMPTLPLLQNASGLGVLSEHELQIDIVDGFITAPDDSRIDVAGSGFYINDINTLPPIATVKLQAESGVKAALHMLDLEPFGYISAANLSPTIADGKARVWGDLTVPLTKKTNPGSIEFDLMAEMSDVTSDDLAPGHRLKAPKLNLHATQAGLQLEGAVEFGNLATKTSWKMDFGKKEPSENNITLALQLSKEALSEFNIELPKGSLKGNAPALVNIALKPNIKPKFILDSSLQGLELAIPALGWRKPPGQAGKLSISGHLGQNSTIEDIRLNAAGLDAKGTIALHGDGTLNRINITRLTIDRWLDTSLAIIKTGPQNTAIEMRGGRVDLRSAAFARADASTTADQSPPLDVQLDQLIVTNGITLHNFRASLNKKPEIIGEFTGKINGLAPVSGVIHPYKYGVKIEAVTPDGGEALRAAGLYNSAFGGEMELELKSHQTPGDFSGYLQLRNTRVRKAAPIADLLDAISVVGLVQKLGGPGIHFSSVKARFDLTPKGVHFHETSAVGPSMGITVGGWYDAKRHSVDFQGVVTPLYAINGAFERLFGKIVGRHKGEGLISFTYEMQGKAADPAIKVNPLSILTPGRLRDIFRKSIPEPLD